MWASTQRTPVVLQPNSSFGSADVHRLCALVRTRLGWVAVPKMLVVAEALPETYSGKYMRALLRKMLAGTPLGDLGALKNPECVEPLQAAISVYLYRPPVPCLEILCDT